MKKIELTKNELQFMNVLWREGTPLTGSEIRDLSVEKTWRNKSLHVIVKNLIGKGAIEIAGFRQDGGVIARTFTPLLSRMDYYGELLDECDPDEFLMLLSAKIKSSPDFSDETMTKLEDIIREWRESDNR